MYTFVIGHLQILVRVDSILWRWTGSFKWQRSSTLWGETTWLELLLAWLEVEVKVNYLEFRFMESLKFLNRYMICYFAWSKFQNVWFFEFRLSFSIMKFDGVFDILYRFIPLFSTNCQRTLPMHWIFIYARLLQDQSYLAQ